MSDAIMDLDDLVPPDKTVKFAGIDYVVPGDMPLVTYLKVNRVQSLQAREGEKAGDVETALLDMVDAIAELLAWNATEADKPVIVEAVSSRLKKRGMAAIIGILGKVYPADDEDEAEGAGDEPIEADVPPPGPTTSGTSTPTAEPSPTAS